MTLTLTHTDRATIGHLQNCLTAGTVTQADAAKIKALAESLARRLQPAPAARRVARKGSRKQFYSSKIGIL